MTENDKRQESLHSQYKSMADDAIALRILDMIEQSPKVSQRKITLQTGLAAGLVHSFMRKVINKGWVKANRVSAKRWLYYITPEGFVEKSRLTLSYLGHTLNNYRNAQALVKSRLEEYVENGWKRLVVAGDNDLGEIAALNIKASDDLYLVATLGGDGAKKFLAGRPALPFEAFDELDFDKALVCGMDFLEWWSGKGNDPLDERLFHLAVLSGNGKRAGKKSSS